MLGPAGLVIGDRVGVARDACLDGRGGLTLEDDALIGFESVLLSWTHRWDNPDAAVAGQGFEAKPITIGESAWIGARAMVLPGLRVGRQAVVGAGAIVTRDVADRVVVGGNPARPIRER